jgi:hypothetical protein
MPFDVREFNPFIHTVVCSFGRRPAGDCARFLSGMIGKNRSKLMKKN